MKETISVLPELVFQPLLADDFGAAGISFFGFVDCKEDRREKARRPYLCRDPVVDRRSSDIREDSGAVFGARFTEQWIRFLWLGARKKRNPGICLVWPTTVGARGPQ
ncbi:hypothetical protein U1Q18_006785 [Sarracenia purpurea var. burkii]